MPEPKKGGLKRLLLAFALLYAALTLIPAAVWRACAPPPSESPGLSEDASSAVPEPQPDFLQGRSLPGEKRQTEPGAFTLYDTSSGRLLTVPVKEFLPAALACEMDLSSPEEALKAQAVAIYTLYSRQRETGEAAVQGADFACDCENWLVYTTKENMRQRWGEDFEGFYSLLERVTEQVAGQILTENGKLIQSAYFAISCGNTESAENVWGDGLPGTESLQAAASPGDLFSDGYLSHASFTPEEFQQAAASYFPEMAELSGPVSGWLTELEYTPSGYVKKALLGGKEVSGTELRAAFSLRSAAFSLEAGEDALTFTVRGWGHGVGMSQAGAVFMAKRGAGYREILAHYYPSAALTQP